MRSFVFAVWSLVGLASVGGCNSTPTNVMPIIGSYAITVSRNGLSDPDVVTVSHGTGNAVVLSFNTGIWPGPGAPSPFGIRGSLEGTKITIASQPATVNYSSGQLDGKMTGKGTLPTDGSNIMLDLSFQPSAGIRDVDGGVIVASDGGVVSLDYHCEGDKL